MKLDQIVENVSSVEDSRAHQNFLDVMRAGGFTPSEQEWPIRAITELPKHFVFISYDEDSEEHILSVFRKDENGGGDFEGMPRFEGSYNDALVHMRQLVSKLKNS